jgi:hypothetical protein
LLLSFEVDIAKAIPPNSRTPEKMIKPFLFIKTDIQTDLLSYLEKKTLSL